MEAETQPEELDARLGDLFSRYGARVFNYARARGASPSDAEDIVEEVFLACCMHISELRDDALPWLLGVTRKLLANQYRKRCRRDLFNLRAVQGLTPTELSAAEVCERKWEAADVLRGLGQLREEDREVILLVAWDGLSQAEAAKVIGCSRPAFAVRLFRARRRLLRLVQNRGLEFGRALSDEIDAR